MLRVIMVSMDRKIANQNSAVSKRMVEYANDLGELHIVIFSKFESGLSERKIAPNIWIYPTQSANRLMYIWDGIKIGKKIISDTYFGESVITADDPFGTGLVGITLKFIFKRPLQIQIHTDLWSYYYRFGGLLNWIRTFISPFVLRRADGIRVVSEKIRRDVISYVKVDPKKVSVLPIFVDIYKYKNSKIIKDLHSAYPSWKNIILMSSRFTREKDIDLALCVFHKLIKKYKDIGLVIVGSGPEESNLKKLTKRLKLSQNVVFEDWQEDLVSYYRTADIFLNTSKYEGYGMTLVEAGASGCPILTTNVGITSDLLDDSNNAFICAVGDEKCLYTKLVTLIENPSIRKSLGQEIQRDVLVSSVSKEKYLQITSDLFHDLVKN